MIGKIREAVVESEYDNPVVQVDAETLATIHGEMVLAENSIAEADIKLDPEIDGWRVIPKHASGVKAETMVNPPRNLTKQVVDTEEIRGTRIGEERLVYRTRAWLKLVSKCVTITNEEFAPPGDEGSYEEYEDTFERVKFAQAVRVLDCPDEEIREMQEERAKAKLYRAIKDQTGEVLRHPVYNSLPRLVKKPQKATNEHHRSDFRCLECDHSWEEREHLSDVFCNACGEDENVGEMLMEEVKYGEVEKEYGGLLMEKIDVEERVTKLQYPKGGLE